MQKIILPLLLSLAANPSMTMETSSNTDASIVFSPHQGEDHALQGKRDKTFYGFCKSKVKKLSGWPEEQKDFGSLPRKTQKEFESSWGKVRKKLNNLKRCEIKHLSDFMRHWVEKQPLNVQCELKEQLFLPIFNPDTASAMPMRLITLQDLLALTKDMRLFKDRTGNKITSHNVKHCYLLLHKKAKNFLYSFLHFISDRIALKKKQVFAELCVCLYDLGQSQAFDAEKVIDLIDLSLSTPGGLMDLIASDAVPGSLEEKEKYLRTIKSAIPPLSKAEIKEAQQPKLQEKKVGKIKKREGLLESLIKRLDSPYAVYRLPPLKDQGKHTHNKEEEKDMT